jgi:protein-tyrosine phosphatase
MSTMPGDGKVSVLFVCLGNICRSPMAEAVFRDLVKKANLANKFEIKSAGTGGWHAGERVHRGTREILSRHGININGLVAKQVTPNDLEQADYIIAMDTENLADLQAYGIDAAKMSRLLDHATGLDAHDVPDPYYDGRFELVYELCRIGSEGLLTRIRKERAL